MLTHVNNLLCLITDGMSDAQNQDLVFYTEDSLMESLGTLTQVAPASVVNSVYKAVTDFVGTGPQFDDMTQLAIQYRPFE